MEDFQEIFERKFQAEILPVLIAGLGNSFCHGLKFSFDVTFFAGVKTAALRSVVRVRVM
jgi:hypothetical protein